MTDIKRSEDLPYSHCQAMEDGKKNHKLQHETEDGP